ncbi:hypothetical protein B0T14DRAFT_260147 [Immersiella caudata]|uniref:Uncharacterized protein n=1 Tax=Immersiella caudata TaxID=314043 RepID=A0AA40BXF9_9PEZI|nr:hypothetical protein B0T14DRAFT_260147 [Immersiella caudata]
MPRCSPGSTPWNRWYFASSHGDAAPFHPPHLRPIALPWPTMSPARPGPGPHSRASGDRGFGFTILPVWPGSSVSTHRSARLPRALANAAQPSSLCWVLAEAHDLGANNKVMSLRGVLFPFQRLRHLQRLTLLGAISRVWGRRSAQVPVPRARFSGLRNQQTR